MSEHEKYIEIREKLRSLPKLKASEDFVNSLQRRINTETASSMHRKYVHEQEQSLISRIFAGGNRWLVPALGFTVVIFIVFAWMYIVSNEQSDTLTQQNNTTETSPPVVSSTEPKTEMKVEEPSLSEETESKETTESTNNRDIVMADERLEAPPTTRPVPTRVTSDVSTETRGADVELKVESERESNIVNEEKKISAMPKNDDEGVKSEDKESDKTDTNFHLKQSLQKRSGIDKSSLETLKEKVIEK